MKIRQPGRGHAVPFRHDAPLPRQLRQLAVQVDAGGLTVRELLASLGEPGLLVLCIIFATPFLLPISIPGSSTPFGILIALIGIGVVADRAPWLPERLLRRPLQGRRWAKLLLATARLTLWLEKRGERQTPEERPSETKLPDGAMSGREPPVTPAHPFRHRLHGLALTLAGVLLTLPLPIPFSNTLPGIAVFLLAGGLLRRGRLLLAAGHLMLLAAAGYLALIAIFGSAGVKALFSRWLPG